LKEQGGRHKPTASPKGAPKSFCWDNPGRLILPCAESAPIIVDTTGPAWIIPKAHGGKDSFNWDQDFFHAITGREDWPAVEAVRQYIRKKIESRTPIPLTLRGNPHLDRIGAEVGMRVVYAAQRHPAIRELLDTAVAALGGELPPTSLIARLDSYLAVTPPREVPRNRMGKVNLTAVARGAGFRLSDFYTEWAGPRLRARIAEFEAVSHQPRARGWRPKIGKAATLTKLKTQVGSPPERVLVAVEIRETAKAWAAHWLRSYGPSCVSSLYALRRAFETLPPIESPASIRKDLVDRLRADLQASDIKKSTAGKSWSAFRSWYHWCVSQQIPGFSRDVDAHIQDFQWRRAPSHLPVRQADPVFGPLDRSELTLIRSALGERKGVLFDRVCVGLLEQLGARPAQFLLLREKDFDDVGGFHSVRLPLLKQKARSRVPREVFPLTSEALWSDLHELVARNRQRFPAGEDLPILIRAEGDAREPHTISLSMFRTAIRRWARAAEIVSPVTGEPLYLNARRFRYTLGTTLTQQGAPEGVVARAMGHRSTSAQRAYAHSSDGMVDRLDATLGLNDEYASQIKRFRGIPIDRADVESTRRLIHGTVQQTLTDVGTVGACGADYHCGLTPPTACYGCSKFQPFIDGPHRKMLTALIAAREELKVAAELIPDSPIPYQLDDAILGCRDCIAACEAKANGYEGQEA
jgi:integrase